LSLFPRIGWCPWGHPSKSAERKPRKDILVLKYARKVGKMFKKMVRPRKVWTTKWVSEPRIHVLGEEEHGRRQKGPEFPELLLSHKSLSHSADRQWACFVPLGIQKRQGRGHEERTEGNAFKAEV